MAKVSLNAITSRMTGKVGDLVFRTYGGQTFAQLMPKVKKRKPSSAQKKRQLLFRNAQAYAAKILADPLQRKLYQELGLARKQPPNALLISNFLTPPTVDQIEASGYKGRPGNTIKVLASDDIEVVSVKVAIRDHVGALLEEGSAQKDHGVWFYTVTTTVPQGQAVTIEATATDRPGHHATLSIRA